MKILLVVHQHLDPNAGASGATLRLGQQYQQQGHDVQYYSFDNLPRKLAKLQNGKVSELTKAVILPEFVAGHLLKLTQKQSIDVVNASTGDAWLWGKVPWSQGKKRPLLVTQSHGLEHIEHLKHIEAAKRGNLRLGWKYPIYNGGFRLWEVHTSMRYSDLVFLLNREEFDYAVEDLRLPPEKAHVFPNGISDDFLNLPFEKTCPSTNETINIAQIGSYIPRKGIEYSAPALNAILLRYPHVRVAFFGTGCSEMRVHEDFEPSIRDRIQVLPRYVNGQLPNLLSEYQILLLPSLSEGFGIAIVEAMACGLAPITTTTSGPKDIVKHEHDGILVPTHDSLAIEQALEKLIRNRAYLGSLRYNAYTTAQSYSWAQIAQNRLSLYKEALAKRGFAHY